MTEYEQEPCEECKHSIMRLVVGRTHTCSNCGAEWEATEKGVYPKGEV